MPDPIPLSAAIPALLVPDGPAPSLAEIEAARDGRTLALRRASASDWFSSVCPSAYHPDATNWAHPSLAPFAASITAVRSWALPPPDSAAPPGLILAGDTFRGKTRAMFALLHRLRVTELRQCAFFSAAGFFARLGEQVNYGRDDARDWVEGVAAHPHFFLDDLGQQALISARADHARQWFFHFLDIRRGERLPLFVTTNLTAAQLSADPTHPRSDPLLSRLLELCVPVKF